MGNSKGSRGGLTRQEARVNVNGKYYYNRRAAAWARQNAGSGATMPRSLQRAENIAKKAYTQPLNYRGYKVRNR